MQLITLQKQLQAITNQGIRSPNNSLSNSLINAFSTKMLESYFPNEQKSAFRKTLDRAVQHGV